MSRQATLDIAAPYPQTLDNFVVGDNAEVLAALKQEPAAEFTGIWLCGPVGAGKSHLLRGACLAHSGDAIWVDGTLPDQAREQLEQALEFGDMVAIDDVAPLAEDALFASLLLGVYQRMLLTEGVLLVAHRQPATQVACALPDLGSRMKSLQHFALVELNDTDKGELLRRRAQHLGYGLSDKVLHYWLTHGPRDLGALLTDLGRLDRASLAAHRQISVPLLKAELGY